MYDKAFDLNVLNNKKSLPAKILTVSSLCIIPKHRKSNFGRSSTFRRPLKKPQQSRNFNFDLLVAGLMMDPAVFYPYNEQDEEHVNEVGEGGSHGGEALGTGHTERIEVENGE